MIQVSNINLKRPWPCQGLWNLKAIRRIFFFYSMREFLLWKIWCLGCSWWDQQGTNKGPSYYLWLTFISKDCKRKKERQSMNTMSHDNIIQCHTRTFDAFCWKESRRIEKNARCCGGRGGCNEIYSIRWRLSLPLLTSMPHWVVVCFW